MNTNKFKATIIGLILGVPGVLAGILPYSDFQSMLNIVSILAALPVSLPLELIGKSLFSKYSGVAFFNSLGLISLFLVFSIPFFRRLLKNLDQGLDIGSVKLWRFFGIQLVLLHPMFFYFWALANSKHSGDGQFIFGMMETFPYSSLAFILLGISIDLLRNQKQAKSIQEINPTDGVNLKDNTSN